MGIIDAYIPMDRRHALARGEELPDRTSGAVLFADISGFTRFNSALFQELGPQLGAEVLTQHLNHIYGVLIAEVHRYGGSVISFGGDAITCWFDNDSGRRASAAALDMQRVMAGIESLSTPSGTQYPFGIKVAVTSGSARRFLVGQPSVQRIEVLAGAILDRMAAAENQLEAGEVVVGAEVMGRFGDQANVKEWRKDEFGEHYAVLTDLTEPIPEQPWETAPSLDTELARNWLLPSVHRRLIRGEGEFLAELRPAVALFIKFHGIDYDKEDDAGDKLDTFIGWVQRILAKYEGLVLNLIVGDKGSYIYCAYGARITHENDVDRALAASLELISPPDELAYIKDIQIGITRGQMRVGAYGSPTRRTYGAQGSEVNLASRLMSLAKPCQIIASQRVVDDASNRYEFSEIGPTSVKGVDEPILIYTLTSMTTEVTTDIFGSTIYPIIGREAEKLVLNEALGAIRLGRSTTIILTGEAGIGKTRLVEYTLSEAQRRSVNYMIALGDEVGSSSLYFAWRPIFMNLFDLDQFSGMGDPSERENRRESILDKLEDAAPELTHLAPLLNEVLMSDFPENDLTKQMSGEVRAENIHILLNTLLSQVAGSAPLLLVVEDAHWLDSASWAMLHSVDHEIHPLLLVIASRPLREPVPFEFTEIQTAPNTNLISLEQFSTEDVGSLLRQRLEVDQLPEPVLNLVYEKAEGNPFFSEELAYVLRESGLIEIDNSGAHITSSTGVLQSLDFPDTSQDVIRSRIDRLAPEEGLAIKIASVIGRTFLYMLLYDIHPVDADRPLLTNYLDALERSALTRLLSPEPDLTYRFRHNITHEVAYNLMLITQRRELHRSIAEWYERTYKEDLSQFYPLLAYHWDQTDEAVKAVEFLEHAGRQAVLNFANKEAVKFFTQALSRADEDGVELTKERHAQIELLLGEAHVNKAEYIEGSLHLERGLSILGQAVPKGTFMQVASVLGQVLLQAAHRMLPGFYFGRRSNQRDTLLAAYRALERLVEVYFMTNKTVLSLYTAFRSLNLAEDAGPSPELARGYSTVGALIGFIPLHGMANNYMRRALEALEGVDDLNAHVWVALTVAFYKAGAGEWEEAAQFQERLVEISEQLGDQRRREDGIGAQFTLNYFKGNFDTSSQYSDELVRISRVRGADLSLAYGLQGQAYVLLHQGQFDIAMAKLEELRTMMLEDSKIKEEGLLIEMYGLLSIAYLRRSETQYALEMAEKALNLTAKGAPSNFSSFTAYFGPANVYLTLWEEDYQLQDIDKLALKANKCLKKYAGIFLIGEPRYLLYEGWYNWLSGKHDKAVIKWDKSLASAIKLDMVYDQGLAYLEIGRHLPHGNPDRHVYLTKASGIFTDIGAAYDLQRCESAITKSNS